MFVSIDAGNGFFKIAVVDSAGNPKLITTLSGQPFFPAVVYFDENGQKLVGFEAQNAMLANPKRGVSGWKRWMGTDKVLYPDDNGKSYKAPDILTILLEKCRTIVETKTSQPVNDVGILIPANYTELRRQQTKEAGARAGMNVMLMPHEPTCAALGNGIHKSGDCTAAVYDLGDGTFDISIVQPKGNLFKVITTGGEPKVGSSDFNKRVEEKSLEQFESQFHYRPTIEEYPEFFQNLAQQIEQLKITLSVQQQFQLVVACRGDLLKMTVTREQFESWIKDLVEKTIQRTEQTLKDAGLKWSDIDLIYAVGGGSMTPLVTKMLEQASGKKVCKSCDPFCAGALGGVIAGRLEYDRLGKPFTGQGGQALPPPEFYMRDILSRPIGVAALDENNKEICCELLSKDTPIPSIQMRKFKMAKPNQTKVRIRILEGYEGAEAAQCTELGYFDLEDLPARPDCIGRIEITFELDSSGLLTATARDTVNGKSAELKIAYENKANAA